MIKESKSRYGILMIVDLEDIRGKSSFEGELDQDM